MSKDQSSQPWYSRKYNEYYTSYVPWLEDKYLAWFGENKTSYTAKENLKTDVTGNESINKVQGGIADGVGGQFSKGGLLSGVGEGMSREGVNRVERGEHGEVLEGAQGKGKGWTESLTGGMMGGGSGSGSGEGGKK